MLIFEVILFDYSICIDSVLNNELKQLDTSTALEMESIVYMRITAANVIVKCHGIFSRYLLYLLLQVDRSFNEFGVFLVGCC